MNAKVIITPGGQIAVMTEEGTIEQGKDVIDNLWKLLAANGIDIDSSTPVESHRLGTKRVEVSETIPFQGH